MCSGGLYYIATTNSKILKTGDFNVANFVVTGGTTEYICVTTYGPLTRYIKFRVAHAPGMPGTFSPPLTSKEIAS